MLLLRAARRWQQRALAECIAHWHGHASEERRQRALAVSEEQRQSALMVRVLGRLQSGALGRAFELWRAQAAETQEREQSQRRQNAVLRRVLGRLRCRELGGAFACWRAEAAVTRRHRALLRRAVARMEERTLSRALSSWCSETARYQGPSAVPSL